MSGLGQEIGVRVWKSWEWIRVILNRKHIVISATKIIDLRTLTNGECLRGSCTEEEDRWISFTQINPLKHDRGELTGFVRMRECTGYLVVFHRRAEGRERGKRRTDANIKLNRFTEKATEQQNWVKFQRDRRFMFLCLNTQSYRERGD